MEKESGAEYTYSEEHGSKEREGAELKMIWYHINGRGGRNRHNVCAIHMCTCMHSATHLYNAIHTVGVRKLIQWLFSPLITSFTTRNCNWAKKVL